MFCRLHSALLLATLVTLLFALTPRDTIAHTRLVWPILRNNDPGIKTYPSTWLPRSA